MDYKFVQSVLGPVIVTNDEVFIFAEFSALHELADSDPDFFIKARAFLKEKLQELSSRLIESVDRPVVGEEQLNYFGAYINAIKNLRMFEEQYNYGSPVIGMG